jgi:hypothetical protein
LLRKSKGENRICVVPSLNGFFSSYWILPSALTVSRSRQIAGAAGLENGGTDCEDAPGLSEGSTDSMFLAYLRDPSGNKICDLHRLQIDKPRPDEEITQHGIHRLAAGPLEELIELHGVEYIDHIEKTAQTNLNFRLVLRKLIETTDKNIWSRILRARSDD